MTSVPNTVLAPPTPPQSKISSTCFTYLTGICVCSGGGCFYSDGGRGQHGCMDCLSDVENPLRESHVVGSDRECSRVVASERGSLRHAKLLTVHGIWEWSGSGRG